MRAHEKEVKALAKPLVAPLAGALAPPKAQVKGKKAHAASKKKKGGQERQEEQEVGQSHSEYRGPACAGPR